MNHGTRAYLGTRSSLPLRVAHFHIKPVLKAHFSSLHKALSCFLKRKKYLKDFKAEDSRNSMILCVPGPRAPLPAAPSTEAPRGMRAGAVPPAPCLQSTPPLWDPTKDLRAIASNFCYLENSGWYWGAITAAQAHAALQEACEGAFLVRDSSHPLYMLTLSVRTARGPTSIRIQYSGAQFLLDSSSPARPSLSSFPNVPSLVQHYMGPERKAEEGKKVEEEAPSKPSQQTIQDTSVVLKLKRAVYKPQGLPSLQHLTRLVINRHSDCHDQLPLPRPLLRYVKDYPFKV